MFSASFTLELEAVSIVPEIENMLTLYKAWIKLQSEIFTGKETENENCDTDRRSARRQTHNGSNEAYLT